MINYILKAVKKPPFQIKILNKQLYCAMVMVEMEKILAPLAINWQRFLPDAFLCPNAPEICSVNPKGYQWFDFHQKKKK